jgi:hypothetical protein
MNKLGAPKYTVNSFIAMMWKHWEQDKAFNGRHQPKKSKATNKAKEGRKDGNQEHPR